MYMQKIGQKYTFHYSVLQILFSTHYDYALEISSSFFYALMLLILFLWPTWLTVYFLEIIYDEC